MTTTHTELETLLKALTELRVALKYQTQWRERAEQQLAEANEEIGRLRAQLKQDQR